MGFIVRNAGLLATVQDLGRVGHQSSGIAASGALDGRSLSIANVLVGNRRGEAGLELTLLGATLQFTAENVVALTGADMGATLDGAPAPRYAAFPVRPGDVLALGPAVSGCRAYLAFAGGLDLPEALGSKSTNLKCGIGGFRGRALKDGDALAFAAPVPALPDLEKRRVPPEDFSGTEAALRAVPGPQDGFFGPETLAAFFGRTYLVTARSDRMGCVMEGEPLPALAKTDIVSDGMPLGAVQVASDGKPIVMLADRQTVGGYAKIAVVASADIPLLAQRKPGDAVRFVKISVGAAQRLYRRDQRALERLERSLAK
jgi:biotin-dependent carboxylase-like uncharacterized protein